MISVVMPTLNAAEGLGAAFAPLIAPTIDGLVREVIVSDGGSDDATLEIAEAVGARILRGPRGRGRQLAAGADAARGDWLLFLHADTALAPGWDVEARAHMAGARPGRETAAAFRFALDDAGWRARALERMVALRCAVFKLPYGDQGLLIARAHYDRIGGFRPMPLMEDVDIVRRIGRRDLKLLRSAARTSAARYRADGYGKRIARNLTCLALYTAGVAPERIAKLYG